MGRWSRGKITRGFEGYIGAYRCAGLLVVGEGVLGAFSVRDDYVALHEERVGSHQVEVMKHFGNSRVQHKACFLIWRIIGKNHKYTVLTVIVK